MSSRIGTTTQNYGEPSVCLGDGSQSCVHEGVERGANRSIAVFSPTRRIFGVFPLIQPSCVSRPARSREKDQPDSRRATFCSGLPTSRTSGDSDERTYDGQQDRNFMLRQPTNDESLNAQDPCRLLSPQSGPKCNDAIMSNLRHETHISREKDTHGQSIP
jgi:hypothetical protein